MRVNGCTCKLRNTSTVDKKTTVRSAAWRGIFHSPERYIPVLTAIRVAVALKVFCQYRNRTDLPKHTRFNAPCIHMHCKLMAPSSPQQQLFFLDSIDFLLSLPQGSSNHSYTSFIIPLVTRLAQPLPWLR